MRTEAGPPETRSTALLPVTGPDRLTELVLRGGDVARRGGAVLVAGPAGATHVAVVDGPRAAFVLARDLPPRAAVVARLARVDATTAPVGDLPRGARHRRGRTPSRRVCERAVGAHGAAYAEQPGGLTRRAVGCGARARRRTHRHRPPV